jgi:ABC-type Fe3+-citrate transport system substrate-binding protein
MMRIVSLVPSITEALCQLGLEDSIVGVTDFCTAPAQVVRQKARVGGTKNPDLRLVAELRPDLVIVNTDENRLTTARALEARGLKIVVTQTDSLDQVEAAWTQLGEALGRQGFAARERERISRARERNRQRLQDERRLRALIMVWKSPWMASGSGTYIESLLESCGIDNVLAHIKTKWIRVTLSTSPIPEEQATHATRPSYALPQIPEVVLLPTEPFTFTENHRDDFAHLLPRERVHVVDGELLSWWLSRTAEALEHFYQLHQDLTAKASHTDTKSL